MKEKRKINYYEVLMTNEGKVIENLDQVFELIEKYRKKKSKKRRLAGRNGTLMQFSNCKKKEKHYYFCCIKSIKNEFPEIINTTNDGIEAIDAEFDEEKALYDETHFVLSMNPKYKNPILALESTLKGAKTNDISNFLNRALINLDIKDTQFRLEPVFTFKYEGFMERIYDVSQIKMMFHKSDLAAYGLYDKNTSQLLQAALQYADSEYITLEFKINFQHKKERHPTKSLRDKVGDFINLFRRNPEAKEHIRKLDIRAQDKKNDGKLRLFDLIEEKVASDVIAERKRLTSQYYRSSDLYYAIKQKIEQDFRSK